MTAKDFLDKASVIKRGGSGGINFYRDRATLSGAFIGTAAGAYVGYSRKMNMLATSIFGGVLGAIGARLLLPA